MSDTYTALTDVVTFLESIDKTLDRIADVMELDREDRKAREEAEERVRFARAEQEDRETEELHRRLAEPRDPAKTAGRDGPFYRPF